MIAQVDKEYIRTRPTKLVSRLVSYALYEGRPLTTKGRWINPLVFALLRLQRALPAARPVRAPIYVLGTGRSGTTILGVVMSMHNDVAFLNEPKAMWHVIRDDEDVIGSYTDVPARYRLGAADATPDVTLAAHRLFGDYLAATASSRVLDKYPELIFRSEFVRAIFPDAKFLFLVRNGWDTCGSIAGWSERLGVSENGETHDWWGRENRKWHHLVDQVIAPDPYFAAALPSIRALTRQTDMAAVEWIATMREGRRVAAAHPDAVLEVRYEALAEHPRDTLTRISTFCGLAPDEPMMKYAEAVMSPAPAKKPFEMDAAIRPLFDETMASMGYR